MSQQTDGYATRPSEDAGMPCREVLSFCLGAEEYGIDILKVQEIRAHEPVTAIPNAPEFIRGVINLRGVIVPIVDLRVKFGVGAARCDAFTVVIVLSLGGRVVGAVVDSVSDVLTLAAEHVRPAPQVNAAPDMRHVTGIGTIDGRMLILLDIERLMLSPEMGLLDAPVH